MRRKLALGLLAIGIATAVMARPVAAFDKTSLHDWYAFRFSGMSGGNAVVGSGVMQFFLDAGGSPKMAGRGTLHGYSPGGGCPGSIQAGLYTVNADGSGFMSSNFIPDCGQPGQPLNFDIVIVNDGNGFEMMSTVNGGRLWGTAARRGAGPHAAAELAGSFGFQAVSLEPQFEQILQGVLALDGAGLLTGRVRVLRIQGPASLECIGNVVPLASTYSVNADGTGALALGIQYENPATCPGSDLWFLSIAVLGNGRGFEIASSFQGRVFGTATRQGPVQP